MIRRSSSRLYHSMHTLKTECSARHEVQYVVCIIEMDDYRLYFAE